MYNQEQIYNRT